MRKIVRFILSHTYKPMLARYLSATRFYRYRDIHLRIPPHVFHPGFFLSTRLLLRYIEVLPLAGRSFLELGAGSGLISIVAAKAGANVTASDINPVAVKSLKENSRYNGVHIRVVQSDLFEQLPLYYYDVIAINPPFYKRKPQSHADYAWYCGENSEYFSRLFDSIGLYVNPRSLVLLVLSDGCDLGSIQALATERGFNLNCAHRSRNWLETNYIFKLDLQYAFAGTR